MSSAIQLPNEILLSVFELLSQADRFTCQRICQAWFTSARQICYQHIKINNTNALTLLRCFDSNQFCPFLYTKAISIHYYPYFNSQRHLTKEEFTRLIQYCVNLEELSIALNSVYWDYLWTSPSIKLRGLQRLLCPEDPRKIPEKAISYYGSLQRFSSHLTCLVIHCSCDHWIKSSFGHLTHYLALFPYLRQLTIAAGSRSSIIYLHDILKVCSQLTHLVFHLDHPFISQNDVDSVMTSYPSLRELDIYLPNFSISSFDYIQKRFSHLHRLTLKLFHGQNHEWSPEKTNYLQTKLIPFFRSIATYSIKFDMEDGCEAIEASIAKWFKGNTVAQLDVSESRYERTQMELHKEGKRQEIRYQVTWNPQNNPYHPCLRYLSSNGHTISELKITNYLNNPDVDTILRACPSLHTLSLESSSSRGFHDAWALQDSTYRHANLRRIQLKRVCLNISTLKTLSAKAPALKQLIIAHSQLTHDYYACLDKDDPLKECFSFLASQQLVLNNICLSTKNIQGKYRMTIKYNLVKILFP
ncbi:hypothetical protein G6F57_004666 [Rhizopus arrhizus]|uniref:F-box domain-containing protein n=1 Tax=Rhizopus oryzae TaxID=64495 RepID=A0A9P6XH85_RHIOR|nr:hypothetical protein G6F23_007062 [Rhizopus arrhizus]KAG1415945.1 hypothetical protein G6F58_006217 [Rhizopus delemar]KAG0762637.1 hypothetical protein G6F24_006654 [Rhizopus arrhizus]KAG0788892.1 hypothetical protein G6F21_006898 [Rhizopus arrhizus]KAG0792198.1 hypothetical protein G6F22_005932 [Rhizopus arrhizus]